ncbi:RDD family protein [Jiangella muralis]|uniref:RDD family protein n=1 Tax=Jiangella muralis TaxID=702383 RepID=UPI00069EDE49|nr:RDD family protein [Jiangella muralis]
MSGAGLVSRSAAALVDVAVVAAATVVAGLVLSGIRYTVEGPPFELPPVPGWAFGAGHSLLVVAYLTTGWALTGRTPGQLVLGLRVVTRADRSAAGPLGVGRALVRAVVTVVFPIGVLWTLVSRDTRAVGDVVARTAVVYDPPREAA